LGAVKRDRPTMTISPEQQAGLRKNVAFRLLLNAVLDKYVTDNKIEVDKAKFETEFAKLKEEQAAKGKKYEAFLADNGMTDEEFRKAWQSSWALEQKLSQSVPEGEVTKMLDEQKDTMPLRRASHVLFMYKGSDRAPAEVTRSKDEAKAAAEDVVKKLKAGEDFAKLAAAQSDCPSKKEGGDLNFFPRKGGMVEPFAAATYGLEKVGDYTPAPVETPFGYHVIKLTELKSTDEMKAQIKNYLASQKLNTLVTELVAAAAKGAKFNEKLIADAKPEVPEKAEK
jgi:parvulin-like peptidyl-prolyl isomerase